jgi:hypothetical protein
VRIGKLLDALEAMMALLALVFVKWHGLPETLLNRPVRPESPAGFELKTEICQLRTDLLILGFVSALVNEPAVV